MEKEVINHLLWVQQWLFISLILKGWAMLVRKYHSGQTPLPTDGQGLRVPLTQQSQVKVILRGRVQGSVAIL